MGIPFIHNRKRPRDFLCLGCGQNIKKIGEYFSVKNEIWLQANDNDFEGYLCIGCIEERINRKLIKDDFFDCHCNNLNYKYFRSERFINRLEN